MKNTNDKFYNGEWKNSQYDGYGVFSKTTLQNTYLEKYEGNYLKGKKHGFGVYTDKKGTFYKGDWL